MEVSPKGISWGVGPEKGMIKIENLTKKFGKLYALKNLNLEIKKGELFGFLGPNGAGKTTTIRILVGLSQPTEGRVLINGHDIVQEPLRAKQIIGYVSDHPYLYEKLTPKEFLLFIAGLYGVGEETARKGMDEYLDAFELTTWRDTLIEDLSHGMRKKLVITASLLHNPQVIIIDEPLVGLDPKSARLLKERFKEIVKRGKTIFMSTHSLEVAQEMCTRIGIIDKGELIGIGTIQELKRLSGAKRERLEEIFLRLTGEEYER